MTCVITDPGHPEYDAPNSGYCTSSGCGEDTDNNGEINVNDLLNVLSDFGSPSPDSGGDVNEDGNVNVTDLLAVLSRFGQGCPAEAEVLPPPPPPHNSNSCAVTLQNGETVSPCHNGGTCTPYNPGPGYMCTCTAEFTGENCQTRVGPQEPAVAEYPQYCVHCTTHTCPEGQYEVLATSASSNSNIPVGCPTCELAS